MIRGFKSFFATLASVAVLSTYALPTPDDQRALTVLTQAQINAFNPFAYFTGASKCGSAPVLAWNCVPCQQLPGFIPYAAGGDGSAVQYWFVGYWPTGNTVVVSHQGTDRDNIIAWLSNVNIILRPLSSSIFPGAPSDAEVHDGFADAHEKTAAPILAAVRQVIAAHSATRVTSVGHSLGGALATLTALQLRLALPSTVAIRTVTFGQPRVGNPEFADYVDSKGIEINRIDNKDDPVPILPGRFLGFGHTAGEIHIRDDNSWVRCSGQDNTEAGCTINDVGNIFIADPNDHSGPYNGVSVRC